MERDSDVEVAFEKKTWSDALTAFRASGHDAEKCKLFLQSYSSPDEAKILVAKAKSEAGAQYGDKVGKILEKVNIAMSMGDIAMKSAPESVGLAWMGVRMCLNAFQDDYATFQLFSGACSDIVGVLISCRIYARAYSCNDRPPQFDELHDLVLSHVVGTYTTIIEFSYQMWKHTQTKAAFRYAKGLFRNAHAKFQGLIESLRVCENKMNKYADQASQASLRHYQEQGLSNDRTMISELSSLRTLVGQIEEDRKTRDLEWIQLLQAQAQNESKRSGLEQAQMNLDRQLELLLGTTGREQEDILLGKIKERQPNTCQWVLQQDEFRDRASSIWLVGAGGAGKSFLMATIAEALQNQNTTSGLALGYCFVINGSEFSRSSLKVLQSLLAQIYSFARGNLEILDACNALVQKHFEAKEVRDKSPSASNDILDQQSIRNTLVEIVHIIDVRTCILVDALDEMLDTACATLITTLNELRTELGERLQVILSSRDSSATASALSGFSVISVEDHTASDIKYHVDKELEKMPGYTTSERLQACTVIAEKAGYDFNYTRLAIDHMRRPWQRPLSNHLANLPAGIKNVYAQRLRQLDPAYHQLLKTCMQWILLAQRPLTVKELMEIDNDSFRLADEAGESLEFDGRLLDQYRERVQYAGSAFIRVSADDTVLPVHNTVRDFFLTPLSNDDKIDEELANCPCARCQRDSHRTPDFFIDEIGGHMKIAITILRQLQSPSFQATYCTFRVESSSSSESEVERSRRSISSSVGSRRSGQTSPARSADSKHDEIQPSRSQSPSQSRSRSGSILSDMTAPRPPSVETSSVSIESVRSFPDSDERSRATSVSRDRTDGFTQGLFDGLIPHRSLRYGFGQLLFHLQKLERIYPLESRRGDIWEDLRSLLLEFCQPSSRAWIGWHDTIVGPSYYQADFDFTAWARSGYFNGNILTPLIVAAEAGLDSLLSILLEDREQRATINNTFGDGESALSFAVKTRHLWPVPSASIFRKLLDAGANPNLAGGIWSETPFTALIKESTASGDDVRLFLSHGADLSVVEDDDLHPIHVYAKSEAGLEVAKALLDAGADPNQQNEYGSTPMHFLCNRRSLSLEIVKEFISRGARIDEENRGSERPLIRACDKGHHQYAKMLVDLGANVNDTGRLGYTALMRAAESSHECVEILLAAGADPSIRNDAGTLPVAAACRNTDVNPLSAISIAQAMMVRGTVHQLVKPDQHGKTVFMKAAACNQAELLKILLQRFDPKQLLAQRTEKGWQALHFAALGAASIAVQVLLENGADPCATTTTGLTPLQMCYDIIDQKLSPERESTIMRLAEHNPENAVNDIELMHILVSFNSIRTVDRLLQLGADPSAVNTDGWDALMLAESYGFNDMLSLLLKHKKVKTASGLRFTTSNNEGFSISEDGLEITLLTPESFCPSGLFMTCSPIPADKNVFYFELRLTNLDDKEFQTELQDAIIIGLGRKPRRQQAFRFDFQPYGSRSADYWAYNVQQGWIQSVVDRQVKCGQSGAKRSLGRYCYRTADVVGCLLNMVDRTVSFTKNGFELAIEPLHELRGPVHAMLYIPIGCNYRIEANFGDNLQQKPYLFDMNNRKDAIEDDGFH